MQAHEVDAYIITSQDAHASEYLAPADERRSFLTGFSGSAGTALVTNDQALLWTDGRYFVQAENQLQGSAWTLMKQFQPGVPELDEWTLINLTGKVVGVDPALVSFEEVKQWKAAWGESVTIKAIPQNLVDVVWTSRPMDPCNALVVHPLKYAGKQVSDKSLELRTILKERGADAMVLSALDQIAWLFNLRGSDIQCNPVFFAYAVITQERVVLFLRSLDDEQIGLTGYVKEHLDAAGVECRPYAKFFDEARIILSGRTVFLEPATCSMAIMDLVPENKRILDLSPVERLKAMKNEAEMEGLRQASIRDSLAICEFFAQLEVRLNDPSKEPIDEVDAAELMYQARSKKDFFVSNSFPTISSVGPNAAIIHYHPEKGTCKTLTKDQVYLCDTGGQFLDGTTDITRTLHFGKPTADERRCFTRVLQGHIALARAVFPEETPGLMLEMLARQPLWQDGLTYGHGTGHGMGAYMNVHEGPMGIGGGNVSGSTILNSEMRRRKCLEGFRCGNFVSNEPGCYKEGEFGIRLESDMLVVRATPPNTMGNRPYVCFEYLTLVPMCRDLVDVELLAPLELNWVNDYHARVRSVLQGKLDSALAEDWLQRMTEPLSLA